MIKKLLLPLALCAVLVPSAPATTPAVDNPGALPILLGLDPVRSELKLDSLQRAVLDSLRGEYKTAARKLTNPMPSTMAARALAEKEWVALTDRYNARALSVLNSGQRKRLLEVEHRLLGATALYTPSVQKKVALTETQKKQVESIRLKGTDFVGKVNRQFEEGKIGYHDRLDLLRARRISQGAALMKILTPEQRSAFVALGGSKLGSKI